MKHFLFTWEYGAGFGHLMPIGKLARALTDRGHRVTLAVPDPEAARKVIPGADIPIHRAPRTAVKNPQPLDRTDGFSHTLYNSCFFSGEITKTVLTEWEKLLCSLDPDAIIADFSPNVLLVARALDIPRCILGTGFFIPPPVFPLPRYNNKISFEELGEFESGMLAMLNRISDELRWPAIEKLADLFNAPVKHVIQGFPELDHYLAREPDAYTGFWPAPDGGSPLWPDSHGLKMFFYLKPLDNLEALVNLLAKKDWNCLIYQGQLKDDECRELEKTNIRITNKLLSIKTLCEHTDLFVSNGNAATVTEFLLAGIPCFCAPVQMEQVLFSKRVRKMGAAALGLAEHEQDFVERLEKMTRQLPDYRQAARQFAQKYDDWNPQQTLQKAVNIIESLD